eukprot:m51a1_g7828 hypothetical protein (196) ;mRNA; r:153367-155521
MMEQDADTVVTQAAVTQTGVAEHDEGPGVDGENQEMLTTNEVMEAHVAYMNADFFASRSYTAAMMIEHLHVDCTVQVVNSLEFGLVTAFNRDAHIVHHVYLGRLANHQLHKPSSMVSHRSSIINTTRYPHSHLLLDESFISSEACNGMSSLRYLFMVDRFTKFAWAYYVMSGQSKAVWNNAGKDIIQEFVMHTTI